MGVDADLGTRVERVAVGADAVAHAAWGEASSGVRLSEVCARSTAVMR